MSLEPINSSVTKHPEEISHALLALCTKNPEWLSRGGHSLRTDRKHNPDEEHHMFFEGKKCS